MSQFKLVVNEFVAQAADCDARRYPEMAELIGELTAVGFAPLGVKREQCEGQPVMDAPNFVHEGHRAFACLFLAKSGAGMAYLLTPFEKGRAVLTGWYPRKKLSTDWVIAQGVDGPVDVYGLLEVHRRGVAELERKGHKVVAEPLDQELRLRACVEWYANPDT